MDIAGLAVPVRLCRDAFAPGVGFSVGLGSKLVKESHIIIRCLGLYDLNVVIINSSKILPVSEAAVKGVQHRDFTEQVKYEC